MNWWRAHHGISNDVKLSIVATRSKARRCEVGWVWIILIDFASQQDQRGSIKGLDCEQISVMAEIDISLTEEILNQLRLRGLISEDERLTSWEKRQPARERPDDVSNERVAKSRAMKRHVTPCNAMKRPEEIRGDEKRQEHNIPDPPVHPASLAPEIPPPPMQHEYPETLAVIREHDTGADAYFCVRIADAVARAVVGHPDASQWPPDKQRKAVSDSVIARACRESYATPGRAKNHGTGLLLNTVPNIVIGGKTNYA